MPDFMTVSMQMCASIDGPKSVRRGDYTVSGLFSERHTPHCTCKGYQFRKNCRHIKEVQEEACGWHEQFGRSQEQNGVCPDCGGPTVTVPVAV